MADVQVIPWNEIDITETITETDQKMADTLDQEKQPGHFLCEVVECNATENTFGDIAFLQASLKMKILQVLEFNQPIKDKDGKFVKRDDQIVSTVRPVPEDKKKEVDALYVGSFLQDDIRLFHPKEKETFKKRRVFVAKRLGLIPATAASVDLTAEMWASAPGKVVIVKTSYNTWTDKNTKEVKKNVKVDFFAGYDYASKVTGKAGGVQPEVAPVDDDEEFANI